MVGTMYGKGHTYDEFTVGEKFRLGLPTVKEAYVNSFCCLTGDLDPLHVDGEVAKRTIYGERVAPGTLTASPTFTAFATFACGTGMALLELDFGFPAPVRIDDALEVEIEVLDEIPSRKYADRGGIIHQRVTIRNQDGIVVAEATARALVSKVPSYEPLERHSRWRHVSGIVAR